MRIWQIQFQVYKPIPSFPFPNELVEEIQTQPSYRHEGRHRMLQLGGQLVCTLKGVGGFQAGGVDHRLPPGRAFLSMHADPNHAYYYPPEAKEPWVFLWMSMCGDIAETMIAGIVKRHGYLFDLDLEKGLVKRLLAYKTIRDSVQTLSPSAAAKLVMDTLAPLGEAAEADSLAEPSCDLVRKACQLVLENLDRPLGVDDMATRLGVSREHLSRVFKEQIGIPPAHYIALKKTRLACHLLLSSSLSCKEVAFRLGHDNASGFSRAFKQVTGLSPDAFRASGTPISFPY